MLIYFYVFFPVLYVGSSLSEGHQTVTMMNQYCHCFIASGIEDQLHSLENKRNIFYFSQLDENHVFVFV